MAATSASTVAPRWLKLALLVSLALNCLIIGIVFATLWRVRHHGPIASSSLSGGANLISFASTLPAERRRDIWRDTAEQRRELRSLRSEVRLARDAVKARLLAPEFSLEQFTDAQNKLQEAEAKARAEAQRMFLKIVGKLKAEERAAFAKWYAASGPKSHGRPRHWFKRDMEVDTEKAPPEAEPPNK